MKLKVTWTKDQLKNAPDFQYYKAPSAAGGGGPDHWHGSAAHARAAAVVRVSGVRCVAFEVA